VAARCLPQRGTLLKFAGLADRKQSPALQIVCFEKKKKYNSWDSHVATFHTTNQPACGCNADRSRVAAARVSLDYGCALGEIGVVQNRQGAILTLT
jgi:hypothetical protein